MKTKPIFILAILLVLLAVGAAISIRAFKARQGGLANTVGGNVQQGVTLATKNKGGKPADSAGASKGVTRVKQGNSASGQGSGQPKGTGEKKGDTTVFKEHREAIARTMPSNKNAKNSKPVPLESNATPAMVGNKSATLESKKELYKPFLKKYPLSDEQLQLIHEASLKRLFLLDDLMRQGKYEENKEEPRRRFAEELRESLGDEALNALMYYQETMMQRKFANEIAGQIRLVGSPLSDENIDSLVDVLRKNLVVYVDEQRRSKSPKEAKYFLTTLTSPPTKNNVMREASEILTPEQMDVMKNYWESLVSTLRETASSETKE